MTAPWKTCTRSRLPSTTRTCTLTVSPGRNSGMSSRRLSRSMISVGCMGRVLQVLRRWAELDIVAVPGQQLHLAGLLQQLDLGRAQATPGGDQVRAPLQRPHKGLEMAPTGHTAVVP